MDNRRWGSRNSRLAGRYIPFAGRGIHYGAVADLYCCCAAAAFKRGWLHFISGTLSAAAGCPNGTW